MSCSPQVRTVPKCRGAGTPVARVRGALVRQARRACRFVEHVRGALLDCFLHCDAPLLARRGGVPTARPGSTSEADARPASMSALGGSYSALAAAVGGARIVLFCSGFLI